MKNLQQEIDRAKQEAVQVFQEKYQNDVDGYVPCVFIQRLSPRKTHVGWRFTKTGTPVHEIQQDVHPAYDHEQRIVWVWSAKISELLRSATEYPYRIMGKEEHETQN